IFTISETIIYFNAKKFVTAESKPLTQAELKKLWIISIVSAAVLLINPHGISTYIYAYGHTKMKMLETVNEWRSPFTGVLDFGITLTMYKLFLYSGVLVLIYSYIRKDVLFGLMFIAMAIYSVRAIRFTVDYNMIMIFFIAVSVNYFVLRIKSHQVQNFMNGNVLKAAAGILLIYLITLIPSNSIYEKMQYYRMFGWGVDGQFLPVQLFDFMKESGIRGTPYNHFGTGGSLVWNFPDQKNFIDSRNLNDEIFNEYNNIMRMAPGFDKKLDERGVDYVVYLDPDLIRRPNDLKTLVTNYFSTNPKWKLVFWDDKSMLFVKDIPKFKEVIEKYEYKVIDPYLFLFNRLEFESSLRKDPETGKKELKRKTDSEPAGFILQNINQISGKILKGM
ncbi:MAG: hypothetical protein IT281_07085, partial [Ignavibacteria bacterium]|nr:hypothetical protein [Ignavibacteria bacterium]